MRKLDNVNLKLQGKFLKTLLKLSLIKSLEILKRHAEEAGNEIKELKEVIDNLQNVTADLQMDSEVLKAENNALKEELRALKRYKSPSKERQPSYYDEQPTRDRPIYQEESSQRNTNENVRYQTPEKSAESNTYNTPVQEKESKPTTNAYEEYLMLNASNQFNQRRNTMPNFQSFTYQEQPQLASDFDPRGNISVQEVVTQPNNRMRVQNLRNSHTELFDIHERSREREVVKPTTRVEPKVASNITRYKNEYNQRTSNVQFTPVKRELEISPQREDKPKLMFSQILDQSRNKTYERSKQPNLNHTIDIVNQNQFVIDEEVEGTHISNISSV